MQVLIVEDDSLMRELLCSLLLSIDKKIIIHESSTVEDGLQLWRTFRFDLIVCDWHLPGNQDGIELVRQIRQSDTQIPILMITGQPDRQKVISSGKLGINAFISKPFDIKDVIRRFRHYLQPEGIATRAQQATSEDFLRWAADTNRHQAHLETVADVRSAIEALEQDPLPTARTLSKDWQAHTSITTHLIRIANSATMRREGTHVSSLLDAITLMGVDMALQQVIALALNDHGQLRDKRLSERQTAFASESQAMAQQAATLAKHIGEATSPAYTAGLMHRLGESAVLLLAQHYLDQGGELTDDTIDKALTDLSSLYGNAMKVVWRLPILLRERIGASHWLPGDAVRRELILMRVAACRTKNEIDSPEYHRAVRQLGLDS